MDNETVYSYITTEKANFKTARVPLTNSKDWNMSEHIERCTNVANGWFHKGKNDGLRPYDDIVTPVINVAFRSEGFDVKDIVPFVDDASKSYLSFFIKKYQPQWARKHELDTFIDDVVETSIIYDLALIKNVNNVIPEVIDLKTIAFCDQTDVLAGPICLEHQYTPSELVEFKGKWDDDKIDQAIELAVEEISVSTANDQVVKTPGKYIKVYELRGNLPERWLKEDGKKNKFINQMHIVCYYTDKDGNNAGITLYSGKDKKLSDNFKALKIDRIRSKGRACGKSIVETLFEPQVWNNYAGIKLKNLLDSALTVFITDSDEVANQNITNLKSNTILKQNKGDVTQRLDGTLQNVPAITNYQAKQQNDARILGSASEGSLGMNPVSGTPFALQDLIVQEGQGMHTYRQGKIATFFADVLYRDWILEYMVNDLIAGKKFSEEMTMDEMNEIYTQVAENEANRQIAELMFDNKYVSPEQQTEITEFIKAGWMKKGSRGFFEVLKDDLKNLPMNVFVNIKAKQKDLAGNADKLSKLIMNVTANAQAISLIPGLSGLYNELIEASGLSPINFSQITKALPPQTPQQAPQPQAPQPVA